MIDTLQMDGITTSTIGNITIAPRHLKSLLKKSSYYLDYDPAERKIRFWANDGGGGVPIFEIEQASFENAEKIAKGLGLENESDGVACHWHRWNPKLTLRDDGSENAERLRMEMLRLGIPHEVQRDSELGLVVHDRIHRLSSGWTIEQLLIEIRNTARIYEKQLAATP
ncbi:MAG TPA: hypothetical protein VNG29_01310 [Candidatus Paceibacterota bacterium]|nr:hypothetical protein [Candidatus Paceibacterota bacterium]